MTPPPFRLGYVPGVTPSKWARIWAERYPVPLELVALEASAAERAVQEHQVDAALLRPPVDCDILSAIVLYQEAPVVVASSDHSIAALGDREPVLLADLAPERFLIPGDDVMQWPSPPGTISEHRPASTAAAVELVATGMALLIVPQSLARLHHRKDVTYRFLADGPPSPVALVWVTETKTDEIEDLIGIVRGRTVNSSRGRPTPAQNKQVRIPHSANPGRPVQRRSRAVGRGRRPRRGKG